MRQPNYAESALKLDHLLQQLTAEIDLQAFLTEAATTALALSEIETAGLYLKDASHDSPALQTEARSDGAPRLSEAAQAYAAQAMSTRQTVVSNGWDVPGPSSAEAWPGRNAYAAALPIPSGGACAGALVLLATRPLTADALCQYRLLSQLVGVGLFQSHMLAAEREQRQLAEALFDSTAALNSSLSLEEVLDRILLDVRQVVPHDAAHVLLIDGPTAHVVRSRGYAALSVEASQLAQRFEIAAVPQLRRILETDRPLAVPDTGVSANWVNLPDEQWIRSYAGAPIRMETGIAGFLSLDSATPGFFTADHARWLQAFADQAALALQNARLHEQIQRMAQTDELTGLLNRHGLIEAAQIEITRSQRYGRPLAAAMADLDQFKQINDQYGHLVGDQALRAVADHFRSQLRPTDIVARLGGDELFIILPETDATSAVTLAERLCARLSEVAVRTTTGDITINVCVGITTLSHDRRDLAALLRSADQALYQAKAAGRNRVHLAAAHPPD